MYDMDAQLPAHLAAAQVGVSRQLFSWWVRAGHLEPVAHDGNTPLYRFGDALHVERQMRRSSQSRRKAGATA
jgi:predicted site-specific integrase-resolvase